MKTRYWKSLSLVLVLSLAFSANVTQAADYLLIVDSSGSMQSKTSDGITKMEAAKKALSGLQQDLEPHDVGMLLFGHRVNAKAPGCCQDIEFAMPIKPMASSGFSEIISRLAPKGSTPLAASLTRANWVLQGRQKDNEKYVIVITDGADTCGGDPAVAASAIRALGINVTIHVVGFGVTEQESTQLEEIAKQGGGEFRSASNLKGLVEVLKKVIPPVEKKPSLVVVKKPAPQLEAAPLSALEKILVARLLDKNGYVRLETAKTLQARKATATVSYLRKRVSDDLMEGSWASAKDAALNAVVALAPETVTETLLDAAKSKNDNVRLWATNRLAAHGGDVSTSGLSATDAILVKLLTDKNGYLRLQAAVSLQKRKATGAVPHLAKRVGDELMEGCWASAKDASLNALKSMAPEKVEDALVVALSAKNDNVRNWATQRLSTN